MRDIGVHYSCDKFMFMKISENFNNKMKDKMKDINLSKELEEIKNEKYPIGKHKEEHIYKFKYENPVNKTNELIKELIKIVSELKEMLTDKFSE